MPWADVGQLRLYFERAGSGPPLLFISGSGGDLRNRPNIFEGPLKKSFDIVAFDQRGLGQSDKPPLDYTMSDYAEDAAQLMRIVGWSRAHVLGVSFGGMVALEFAIRHPQLVDRLVLACTSPGGEGGSSYPFHHLNHLQPEARAQLLIEVSDTRHDEAWRLANPEAAAQLVKLGSYDAFADELGRKEGYLRQLAARAKHDTFDRLDQIKRPTMIAAGRYDGIAKPEAQEAMAARIPGSRLRFFEGGHAFLLQDRLAFGAVAEFLSEPEGSAATA